MAASNPGTKNNNRPARGRDFMRRHSMSGKKKEAKTGRMIYIPEEHVEKLAELADAYFGEKSCVNHLRAWRFIHEILPETREGNWALDVNDATRYFVEERL
jgi:Holliday junction resolvase